MIVEEDAETKIFRNLVLLETDIRQYESVVASVKKDIIMLKDAKVGDEGVEGREEGKEKFNRGDKISNILVKLFNTKRVKTSNIFDALPHLMDYEEALTPALTLGKDREGGCTLILQSFI